MSRNYLHAAYEAIVNGLRVKVAIDPAKLNLDGVHATSYNSNQSANLPFSSVATDVIQVNKLDGRCIWFSYNEFFKWCFIKNLPIVDVTQALHKPAGKKEWHYNLSLGTEYNVGYAIKY